MEGLLSMILMKSFSINFSCSYIFLISDNSFILRILVFIFQAIVIDLIIVLLILSDYCWNTCFILSKVGSFIKQLKVNF